MLTWPELFYWFAHASDAEHLLKPLFRSEKNAVFENAVCSQKWSIAEYGYVQELPVRVGESSRCSDSAPNQQTTAAPRIHQ